MSKEIEDELGRSLGDGSDGLMWLSLRLSSERSVLLLTAHHSAAEANTSLFIIEDLLASMAGETLTGERPWQHLALCWVCRETRLMEAT